MEPISLDLKFILNKKPEPEFISPQIDLNFLAQENISFEIE